MEETSKDMEGTNRGSEEEVRCKVAAWVCREVWEEWECREVWEVCTEEVWVVWEAITSKSSSILTAGNVMDLELFREKVHQCLAETATKSRVFVPGAMEVEWIIRKESLVNARKVNTVAKETRTAEIPVVVQVMITAIGEEITEARDSMVVREVKDSVGKAMEEVRASEVKEVRALGVRVTSTKEGMGSKEEEVSSKDHQATIKVMASRKDGDEFRPYFETLDSIVLISCTNIFII